MKELAPYRREGQYIFELSAWRDVCAARKQSRSIIEHFICIRERHHGQDSVTPTSSMPISSTRGLHPYGRTAILHNCV